MCAIINEEKKSKGDLSWQKMDREFQAKLTPKTKETTMQIRTTQTTTLTDQIKTTMQISVTQTIGSIHIADRITVKSNYEVILWDGSTDKPHSTKRRSENDFRV